MLKRYITLGVILLCYSFICCGYSLAQVSAGQIERQRVILDRETALQEKVSGEEKIFIKKVILSGVTLLSEDQVKEITLPFENHWLSRIEIQEALDLIKSAYYRNGYSDQPKNISFKINKSVLEIQVEELKK